MLHSTQKSKLEEIPTAPDLQVQQDSHEEEEEDEKSPMVVARKGMVPYLESPAPMEDPSPRQRSLHQRKRLSFHLLYDGNEINLDKADDDAHVSHSWQTQIDNNNDPFGSMTSHASEIITTNNATSILSTAARQSSSDLSGAGLSNEIVVAEAIARVASPQAKVPVMIDSSHHNSVDSFGTNEEMASATASHLKSTTLPTLPLSKDKRSKWLDHLNSFQESNHDVDIQMQEFIKVPGAVEKTLTSGFLICMDSFLYVCTILPIRFVWSLVLLSLHYSFKWTKKPPGKLQFHRR